MSALRDLQTDFAAAVFADDAALLAHCAGDPSRAAQGIAAYRRSVLANLAGAVQATYPVVEKIVGQEFLGAVCRRYAQAIPSTGGDLNTYGGELAEFLAADPATAGLPYLPDIARLEWLIQQIYGAADAAAQDLAELAATSPAHWGDLRFSLDPAHALLASPWPIVRIWQINQPGYDGDFTVDFSQAENALIHRQPQGIAVEGISAGELAFIAALACGRTLAEALAAAPEFDLQATLQNLLGGGLLRCALNTNGGQDA